MGYCDEGIKILNEASVMEKKRRRALNTDEFKNIFVLFGKIYTKKRNFQEALKYFEDSLRIQYEAHDDIGLANVKDDIGDMYAVVGNTEADSAKAFYSESLRARTLVFGCDDINTAVSLIKVAKLLAKNELSESAFGKKLLVEGKLLDKI